MINLILIIFPSLLLYYYSALNKTRLIRQSSSAESLQDIVEEMSPKVLGASYILQAIETLNQTSSLKLIVALSSIIAGIISSYPLI